MPGASPPLVKTAIFRTQRPSILVVNPHKSSGGMKKGSARPDAQSPAHGPACAGPVPGPGGRRGHSPLPSPLA
ncbi:hypothetical protein GCM10010885_21160 [Alicyclobacillus cellulosilyticus]|uniref:Uncharacterized protein n=1 Tax=Alicyclobacillus cellulosilyticus TaxID=1003997 RepID=A0A917KHJ3_9BACL|nr:hypothetical protein GCM10010885_21160 [Alicyclobacillus cellulosilyticus]